MRSLREKLKLIRLRTGLPSMQAFADSMNNYAKAHPDLFDGKINFTKSMISRWESGRTQPTNKYLRVYVACFRLNYNDLLDDTKDRVGCYAKNPIYKIGDSDEPFYYINDSANATIKLVQENVYLQDVVSSIHALDNDQKKTIMAIIVYMQGYNRYICPNADIN